MVLRLVFKLIYNSWVHINWQLEANLEGGQPRVGHRMDVISILMLETVNMSQWNAPVGWWATN